MTDVRWDMDGMNQLAWAYASVSSASTSNFDFGTPNDLYVPSLAGYSPGARLLVVFIGLTGGTTNVLTWSVQDAPDSGGSIGTAATAQTNPVAGALVSAAAGNAQAAIAVRVQPGRPWIRCRVASDGTTDTFDCQCLVYAVPQNI